MSSVFHASFAFTLVDVDVNKGSNDEAINKALTLVEISHNESTYFNLMMAAHNYVVK